MRVLEVRPARIKAALVEIGDMLVSSPIGADGERPSRWLGAVTEHIIVQDEPVPAEWRQWRIQLVDGQPTETIKIPADGWVWVHLPSAVAVQPTVDGIRGHQAYTPEDDELRRRTMEQVAGPLVMDCRFKHGAGQPDCPECWPFSERNPNRVERP